MFSELPASVGSSRYAALPGASLVAQRVADLYGGHVAPDVPQDQVQRRQPLLPVDQLPLTVAEPLHHDRLEVVVLPIRRP